MNIFMSHNVLNKLIILDLGYICNSPGPVRDAGNKQLFLISVKVTAQNKPKKQT